MKAWIHLSLAGCLFGCGASATQPLASSEPAPAQDEAAEPQQASPATLEQAEAVDGPEGGTVKALRRECEAGKASACADVGEMYLDGELVPGDAKKAARFLSKGCEGDARAACVLLAGMYMNGRGVTKDAKRSLELLKKSCRLGDQSACAARREVEEAATQ